MSEVKTDKIKDLKMGKPHHRLLQAELDSVAPGNDGLASALQGLGRNKDQTSPQMNLRQALEDRSLKASLKDDLEYFN